jgi:hypothetical protein
MITLTVKVQYSIIIFVLKLNKNLGANYILLYKLVKRECG